MIFEGDCVVRTATGAVLRCSVLGVRLVQRGFRCSVLTARFSVLGKGPPRRQRKRQQVVFRNPQFAVRSSELAVRPREPAVNNQPLSRSQSVHHPWKRDRLSQVWQATDPRYGALKSQPESCVGECAILTQVEIPAVGVEREALFLDTR